MYLAKLSQPFGLVALSASEFDDSLHVRKFSPDNAIHFLEAILLAGLIKLPMVRLQPFPTVKRVQNPLPIHSPQSNTWRNVRAARDRPPVAAQPNGQTPFRQPK